MTETALVPAPVGPLATLWRRTYWRGFVFTAGAVLLGALGGAIWAWTTTPPSYRVGEDLSVSMSELSLADIVAADVSFTVITAVIGLAIGVAGWVLLHRLGWIVTLVPAAAALLASLMCWRTGMVLGTSGFEERLAAAAAGDLVQVDLQLRALSALLVGPFLAVTPVMLLSAFWPEPRGEQGEGEPAVTQ